MKRSEYKIGEFLYGIPDSEESAKYNPESQRVLSIMDIRTVMDMEYLSDGTMEK